MLTELARLTLAADGRYATDTELAFLETYLATAQERLQVYEKVRNAEPELVARVEAQKRKLYPQSFQLGGRDVTEICRRDFRVVLRWSAAAMLGDDLARLRDGFLLWYRTIVRANGCQKSAGLSYLLLQQALNTYLGQETAKWLLPAIQLDLDLLGE